ncbi:hypothetical protein KAR91_21340 [Candidatus Pacearchaeota archaeon]|nr:hypothetical protein [Candidatus Pacearchaeota archaeon]
MTVEKIIPRKEIAAAETIQYTAPSTVVIDKFTVTNTSSSTVLFSCNLPASGDATGDENLVLDSRPILAGETYPCPELAGQVLEIGDYISTLAGAGSSLTISAGGRVIG